MQNLGTFGGLEKYIYMVVSRFEVPGKEPVPFLNNLWQSAKVLVLKLKTNEVTINKSKIDQ